MEVPTLPVPPVPGPGAGDGRDRDLLRAVAARLVALAGRVDAAGRIIQIEGPLLESSHVHPGDYLGRNALAAYPDAAPALRRAMGGEPAYLDWTILAAGAPRQMEVNLLPEAGGGATFFLRDVSERRRLEREVLEISDSEQRRIGQDLHDGLGQHLAGTAYLAEILRQQLAAAGSPETGAAAQITALIHEAIEQTRAMARNLCPVDLQSHNLRRGLRSLASGVSATYGVRCELVALPDEPEDGTELPLPGGAAGATQLYRIAQEAIGNAVRHGGARHIRIHLGREAGREQSATLRVCDDGKGFDERPGTDRARREREGGGLGLHVMRYRAHHLGGTLSIRPAENGGGTTVCCTFPVVPNGLIPFAPSPASTEPAGHV